MLYVILTIKGITIFVFIAIGKGKWKAITGITSSHDDRVTDMKFVTILGKKW